MSLLETKLIEQIAWLPVHGADHASMIADRVTRCIVVSTMPKVTLQGVEAALENAARFPLSHRTATAGILGKNDNLSTLLLEALT